MRLPFVTRGQYDAVVAMQAQMIDHLRVELNSTNARLHMLRLQGYSEPRALPTVEPQPVSVVGAAIARMAGSDHRKAEMMRRAVARDRADGLSDTDIAQRIYAGTPTDERAEV